ncbi:MAG: PKD domain-containing protein [Anaerolineae bacterium]|nr:PKD domain-containing protein [Anaerolineae bacterium]
MKTYARTHLLMIACFTLLVALFAPASTLAQRAADGWLPFDGVLTPQPPALALHGADSARIDLVAELPGCETESLTVAGQTYTRLFGEGYGYATDLGLPNVPVMRQRVEIPFGASVALEILSADYVDVSLAGLGLNPIYPTQPQVDKLPNADAPFTFDAAFYANGARYPATPVTLGDAYVVRGHRVQTVNIAPVAYDPGAGTLRLYKSLAIRLNLSGSNVALTQARADRYASAAFDATLSGQILNYNHGRPLLANKLSESYLIITADAYESAMQPFVTLKQGQGFNVTMTPLSDISGGGTTAGIKAYIQNAYDTWPTPPSYILLVGDTNTVPGWTGQNATEITDLYYATMDGASDWHPDIARGRFPVRSAAQTTYMVDKYLAYAGFSEEDWLDWASFIGTCDGSNYPVAEGTHNYVIDTYTEPEGYTGTFPNNPQPGGDKLYCITHDAEHDDVVAAVNAGRVMVIYSGHGGHTGWEIGHNQSDVQAITSYGVFPFVASHACVTNDFEETEVFGETWVLQQNKGALVFWGSSDNSQWGPDDALERAMFDSLFGVGPQPTVGVMTDYGLAQTEIVYPSNARYYWETYNVLGDPALKVFLEPEAPTFTMSVAPTEHTVCNAEPSGSNATVTVNSILNYANTVTLLAGSLPDAVNVAFTPASAAAPFTSDLALTVGAGAPQGDYTLVVTATDYATNTKPADVYLRIVNDVAGAPALDAPANGESDVVTMPRFTWDADPLADGYHFQLSANPLFDDLEVDVQSLPSAQYSLSAPLEGGACYWWRAQTENACGDGLWASPFHFSTLTLDVVFGDTMESGTGHWSHAATTGSDGWVLASDDAHSPTHAWHVPDANVVTDSALWMTAPVIVSANSALSFWHHYAFESNGASYYDGGMLEISTNGGVTWSDMGAYITQNGYNGAITASTNPNAGRQAWVADLDAWTEVTADLSAFAGQSIQLRWRFSSDVSVGDNGWVIDDVQIAIPMPANPALVLDAVTPAGGSPFVDTPVQLTGSGFTGTPNVLLESQGLTSAWLISVTLVNSSTLDAFVPAGLDWGTYSVTLFNGDCQQAVLPDAYTIIGTCDVSPTVALDSPGPTELDEAPDFNAVGTGTHPLRYTWDFGGAGAGTALNTATPTFYYEEPGAYTVVVTATDPCGASDVATTTVNIYCDTPTVSAAVDAATVELGRTQHFTATTDGTGPFTYAWDFACHGGGTGFDTATPSFTSAVAGVYTATVTATGPCGVDSDIVVVEVTCDTPTVVADVDTATAELGHAQHFTATPEGTGPFTYAWNFGGAGTGSGATTATPSFTYNAVGVYTVTVTVTGPCGVDTDTVVVTVTCDGAEVSLAADSAAVGLGDAIQLNAIITDAYTTSYAWNFGGSGVVRDRYTLHPSVTYAAPGVYTVTLTVMDRCGSVQKNLAVEVISYPPQVTIGGARTVELGTPLQLTAVVTGPGPFTYAWDFGGEGSGSALDTTAPSFSYAAPGTYTISLNVVDPWNCVTVTEQVLVYQGITGVTITGPTLVPTGEEVTFVAEALPDTATQPVTFVWDNGSTGATAVYSWTTAGSYAPVVTATHAYGTQTSAYDVTAFDAVRILSLDSDGPVMLGEALHVTAVLTGTAPYAYTWDFGGAGTGVGLDTATPVFTYTEAGNYTLTLTATHAYPSTAVQQLAVVVSTDTPLTSVFLPLVLR